MKAAVRRTLDTVWILLKGPLICSCALLEMEANVQNFPSLPPSRNPPNPSSAKDETVLTACTAVRTLDPGATSQSGSDSNT